MSAVTKKRSYSATGFNASASKTPKSKKQKTRRFPNKHDERNYKELLHIIESSRLIIDFKIPGTAIGHIAVYAAGFVEDCLNIHCDDKLIYLHQDADDFMCLDTNPYYRTAVRMDKKHVKPRLSSFAYRVSGWCGSCAVQVIPSCGGNIDTHKGRKDKLKCTFRKLKIDNVTETFCDHADCKREMVQCSNRYCEFSSKGMVNCVECGKSLCKKHCKKCDADKHPLCDTCFDEDGLKYTAWTCDLCPKTIGKQHASCDNERVFGYAVVTSAMETPYGEKKEFMKCKEEKCTLLFHACSNEHGDDYCRDHGPMSCGTRWETLGMMRVCSKVTDKMSNAEVGQDVVPEIEMDQM